MTPSVLFLKTFFKSLLLFGLLSAVQLPGFTETLPDYTVKSAHDSVVVPLDGKFKLFEEQKIGGIRAIAFCLAGETPKDYTRLLSIMSTPASDLKQSPRELMQKMVDVQKQLKETMPALKLNVEIVEAKSDNDVLIKSINGDMNTTMFTRSLKGTDALYQFQYQFHSATVSKEDEKNAIATLKQLAITSAAAQPFQTISLQKSPYEISSQTETLSIPFGAGWKIVEDRVKEPMPIFQYAIQSSVRMISLVPESDSIDAFARMLKIEILPADKAAMTPRQILKLGTDSMSVLDGCSLKVIDDRSDNDITYDAIFSKPMDTMLVKIAASELVTRLIKGADAQYRISIVFPTASVEPAQKTSAIALLKEIKILPLAAQ